MSETANYQSHVLKLCQLLSLSDVPQPLVRLPKQLRPGWPGLVLPSAQSKKLKVCQPETSLPQPACWRVLRVCDWPQAQPSQQLATQPQVCMKQTLPQQPTQAQLSPACPAQVPGATSSVVRLPGSQQPTHGFAASWLRLASGPAQPATKLCQLLSLSDVCPSPSVRLFKQGWPGLDLLLASAPSHRLKVCQPETSLRPAGVSYVSASGLRPSPASNQPQAQVCMKQALPIQQPAQAQLSPARPAQSSGCFAASWLKLATGPAQPATHLSPTCPAQAPAHLRACQPLGRPPALSAPAGSAQRAKVRFV